MGPETSQDFEEPRRRLAAMSPEEVQRIRGVSHAIVRSIDEALAAASTGRSA